MRPPQRLSLVAQTVAVLKEHIVSCRSGDRLGSERELCQQLNVSRVTLRRALAKLTAEHALRAGPGRRRYVAHPRKSSRWREVSRDVVLLSPCSLEAVEPRVLLWIDELREALAKERCELTFLNQRACFSKRPESALEDLAHRRRPSAWVLLRSTRAMQEWFQVRRLPAVIAGSPYEGVRLPAVDKDQGAACEHGLRRFVARGHRCLSLLIPREAAAGDLMSKSAFLAAGASAGADVETVVVEHDATMAGICAAVDRLRVRKPPVTAFLVAQASHALTTLGHLVYRGLRFPQDVALIARDHDFFLEFVVPSVARYRLDPAAYAHRLSRVVIDLTSGGNPPPRVHSLMPQFIAGDTLR